MENAAGYVVPAIGLVSGLIATYVTLLFSVDDARELLIYFA